MPLNTPELAVGVVCVRDGALLLIKRGRDPGAGLWSLPGGRVRPGERLAAAVTRELAEETGLRGEVGRLCGIAERVGDGWHYVILDYWVRADDGEPHAGDDAADVTWATRADLARLECVPGLVDFLDDHAVLERLRDR